MKFPTRIALRYVFSLRSFHLISVITIISIVGIVVGVAALISVLSIFNGFGEFAQNQMIGLDPHIRISAQEGAWIENVDSLLPELKDNPKIQAYAPIINGRVIIMDKSNMQVLNLSSVRKEELKFVSGISDSIMHGQFITEPVGGIQTIVIGAGLANRLGIFPGDTLSLMSPVMIEKAIKSHRKKKGIKALVTGIFRTHTKEYDELNGYSGMELGYSLFKPPAGSAFSIDIRLHDIGDVDVTMNELRGILPEGLRVQSWYDLHSDLYNIMKFERLATFVVLSLIIIIAVFNVLASLSMTVIEKKSDIAALKAMGATNSTMRKIFMTEGLFIGVVSTILGTGLGLLFCYGQQEYGWVGVDPRKYLVDAIPVSIHFVDVTATVVFSLLLSLLATIYPAKRAAESSLIEGIVHE